MSVRIGDEIYNVFRMIVEFALEGLLAFIYKKTSTRHSSIEMGL
jgi:hypothetical protein